MPDQMPHSTTGQPRRSASARIFMADAEDARQLFYASRIIRDCA